MNSSRTAILLITLWALTLLTPVGWSMPAHLPARIGLAAAIAWFLLNAYLWMVPGWRKNVVERRGPLLGFGFAFAAAVVGALVDGFQVGFGAAVGLFFWRMLLLSLPFVIPLVWTRSPYPHVLDAVVIAYGWALPRLPGFSHVWASLPETSPGFFAGGTEGAAVLGPGHLAAIGLFATYFYGVRFWIAAPLDWTARAGDARNAARIGLYAFVGALAAAAVGKALGLATPIFPAGVTLGADAWAASLCAVSLAAVFEELVFRGLLQSGLKHWLPERVTKAWGGRILWLFVAGLAAVHGALGSFGLSALPAFGFSLGVGLAYLRIRRLYPAIIGHAAAWLALYIAGALAASL